MQGELDRDAHRGSEVRSVSVALSGGGHRASLFAVGALLGLADAGVNDRVNVVASVSGGSITNGLLASQGDYRTATSQQVGDWLSPGVATFHKHGLFFPGPRTDPFIRTFFFLVGLTLAALAALVTLAVAAGQDMSWERAWAIAGVETGVLAVLVLIVWGVKRKSLKGRYVVGLLAGLLGTLAAAPAAVLAPDGSQPVWLSVVSTAVAVLAFLGLGKLAIWFFGRRSQAVDDALDEDLYDRALLRDVDRPGGAEGPGVHHVFCSTNLTSGTQAYLSPRLVSGYGLGTGHPAPTLKLSTAVQTSAAFPGGFNARRLEVGELIDVAKGVAEPSGMAADLVDGGVYDNMADQWELGWHDRRERIEEAPQGTDIATFGTMQCDALVVVNAGGSYKTGPLKGGGLRREVSALMRDKSVMYDQTTAIKRRYLYDSFLEGQPLRGAIVQIGQTPFRVPDSLHSEKAVGADVRARATEARELLKRLEQADPDHASRPAWDRIRDLNRDYPTVLSPVPLDRSAELMWHAYVLVRVNTYVLLGLGHLTPDLPQWSLERFREYAASEVRDPREEAH